MLAAILSAILSVVIPCLLDRNSLPLISQIKQAFDEILTPALGDGSRVVVLRKNPIFTNKNDEIRIKFEKIYQNIPSNNYLILQN